MMSAAGVVAYCSVDAARVQVADHQRLKARSYDDGPSIGATDECASALVDF
jgi:hypothetical protein